MKTKLLSLSILLFTIVANAQHTPSFKIKDNPTIGKTFVADSSTINGKKVFNYYRTLTIIEQKRLQKKKEAWTATYNDALSKLYDNVEGTLALTPAEITAYEKDLKSSKDSINKVTPVIDSLSNEYVKEYLQYSPVTVFSFGPKRARAFFDILYDNKGERFSVLNNTGFSIGNNSGSIYSELVSGNLSVLRVSLGAMVSSSSSTDLASAKQEEAYQRLVSNGGNTVLDIEYPLAYIHTRNNQFNFISRLRARGTADFPEFGTTTDDFAGSASVGVDLYADAALTNNKLRFFGAFNYNQIYGSGEFTKNLGIDDSSFTFGQLTLGLVFNNIKLSFIVATLSSESSLQNKNVVAGGQVLH